MAPESNSKLFVWALFLLDGAGKNVDVEDIYLKCFEVAPNDYFHRQRSQTGQAAPSHGPHEISPTDHRPRGGL